MLNGRFGLMVLAWVFLLSCAAQKEEVVGILKRIPTYDAGAYHKQKFGKLLLAGTNGEVYAVREG